MLVPSYHPANVYPVLAVAVTVLLVPYSTLPVAPDTLPPISAVLVNVYLFTVQFAVIVASPAPYVYVCSAVASGVVFVIEPAPVNVQPINVYPVLVGAAIFFAVK